jgi:hypothetical protein
MILRIRVAGWGVVSLITVYWAFPAGLRALFASGGGV